MNPAWKRHWPEYLMEAAELGLFMISACFFVVLLEHPSSPVRQAIPSAFLRRVLMGLAMGTTAISIIFSPLGRRSGAHFNPAVTMTFWRLKKVSGADALAYVLFQFAGGAAGIAVAALILRALVSHPAVHFAATLPGTAGAAAAFAAEVAISFILMSVVLAAMASTRLARFTGIFAGCLVSIFITFEAPISGMSMNPARTFASATGTLVFDSIWIYFLAPPLGMLAAVEARARLAGLQGIHCAKLYHANAHRCIFRCGYAAGARG
ncbi:MAG TPA: aquaporin [Thermoanaerobaculia bacterium]|nr:aquaporin [Thermoanaerobaculia bacterium]